MFAFHCGSQCQQCVTLARRIITSLQLLSNSTQLKQFVGASPDVLVVAERGQEVTKTLRTAWQGWASVKCVGMACMAENGTRGMGDGPKWAFKHASVKTSQKFQQQCFSSLTEMAAIILLLSSKWKKQDQVFAKNWPCFWLGG